MNPNTSTHEILHKAPSFLECTWGGGEMLGKKREAHYKVNLAFNWIYETKKETNSKSDKSTSNLLAEKGYYSSHKMERNISWEMLISKQAEG